MALNGYKKRAVSAGTESSPSQKNVCKKNITYQTKKRNWCCVVYPESLPENWEVTLQQTGLQIAISPLHDKDKNPDMTVKKPHYHVILVYSGPTSYKVVKALTDALEAPHPQPLEAIRGYYRYLTHKDNPEKYQYDQKNIKIMNGFDIQDFVEVTRTEISVIKKNLQILIRDKNILEYSDLMDFLLDNDMEIERDVASNNTYFFDKYISSKRNKNKNTMSKNICKIDTDNLAALI